MEYPVSFNNTKVYSVPDTRFMRHGFALQRPATILQPSQTITPVNMLPYQVATQGVPYGYTLVPIAQGPAPVPRMVPVTGQRNMYSYLNDDDDIIDEEYLPPPPRPRPRSRNLDLDEGESPEMEAFSATTRQIRNDANSILQRLNTSKPRSKASDFFKTYDYDTKSLTPRYLAPPPDRSHLRGMSPSSLDEEPDPFIQSLRPGGRRLMGVGTSTRPVLSTGQDRMFTPSSITASRIQNLYKELDEPLYSPEIKSFDYTECLRRDRDRDRDRDATNENITRRATLMEPSSALGERKRNSYKVERNSCDTSSVRANIAARAQYAAMRQSAGRTYRIPSSEPSAAAHSHARPSSP